MLIQLYNFDFNYQSGIQALWCPSSSMRGVGRGWGNQKGGPAKWGAQPVHNENKLPYTAGLMCAIH